MVRGFQIFCWGCVRDKWGLREEHDSQLCQRGYRKTTADHQIIFLLQYGQRYCSVEGGKALVLAWANLLAMGGRGRPVPIA